MDIHERIFIEVSYFQKENGKPSICLKAVPYRYYGIISSALYSSSFLITNLIERMGGQDLKSFFCCFEGHDCVPGYSDVSEVHTYFLIDRDCCYHRESNDDPTHMVHPQTKRCSSSRGCKMCPGRDCIVVWISYSVRKYRFRSCYRFPSVRDLM